MSVNAGPGSGESASPPVAAPPVLDDAARALRMQILATEHWSLLGTRSTTWSEVMSRIAIHLTVTSAFLVVLALVVQASGFGTAFRVLSIGFATVVLVLGTLTLVRVKNASQDDAAMILGMNRIRAAYVELDPGVARYLTASTHDDVAGLMETYLLGTRRRMLSHVVGSTTMFMNVVNTIVAGTLGALVAQAAELSSPAVVALGVVGALVYFGLVVEMGRRSFDTNRREGRFPSP